MKELQEKIENMVAERKGMRKKAEEFFEMWAEKTEVFATADEDESGYIQVLPGGWEHRYDSLFLKFGSENVFEYYQEAYFRDYNENTYIYRDDARLLSYFIQNLESAFISALKTIQEKTNEYKKIMKFWKIC